MPCYKPLDAWRPDPSSGSKKLLFQYHPALCLSVLPTLQVPCGQCVGCRLERSRQWAIRVMHESKMHDKNCFITLTYNDEHLPGDRSLHYRDFQLFMKRLRKEYGEGIRFYMCGEYGEKVGRPHFHACIFGLDFDDKLYWKTTGSKSKLYRSKKLEALWDKGFSSVGDVNFESAAYVARYIMKKVSGEAAELHYTFCRPFYWTNLSSPTGVYKYELKARHWRRLALPVHV